MSDIDLFELYARCERSAFRLETLQSYEVAAEAEQIRAFKEGRPIPKDPAMERSMNLIRSLATAGKQIQRVHIVDLPLTPYLEYEVATYTENVEAGEEVRIADRNWHPDLADLTEDFVLFDGETNHPAVVWMRYDARGRVEGLEYTEAPVDIERCLSNRDLALTYSVPVDQFTAPSRRLIAPHVR